MTVRALATCEFHYPETKDNLFNFKTICICSRLSSLSLFLPLNKADKTTVLWKQSSCWDVCYVFADKLIGCAASLDNRQGLFFLGFIVLGSPSKQTDNFR